MRDGPNAMNNKFFFPAALAVVAFLLWNSCFVLSEGQQAVITQFGKPIRQLTEAGLKFKKPFIQQVHYFEKKILIWNGDSNQIPTNDKTYIYMENTARWRISNALLFMQAVGSETRARTLLDDILDGTVRDLVNKNDLIEIIRSSDWSRDFTDSTVQHAPEDMKKPKYGRDQISKMVVAAASKITPQYGIELIDVMFKRVNYIDTVREKVYDRMISERKRIAAEKRATGEGQKAEILGRVDREFQEITSNAKKQGLEIRGKADAEATHIYAAAYNADPEFYAYQKSLESYRSVLGANSTLMLSPSSDFLRYLQSPRKP